MTNYLSEIALTVLAVMLFLAAALGGFGPMIVDPYNWQDRVIGISFGIGISAVATILIGLAWSPVR